MLEFHHKNWFPLTDTHVSRLSGRIPPSVKVLPKFECIIKNLNFICSEIGNKCQSKWNKLSFNWSFYIEKPNRELFFIILRMWLKRASKFIILHIIQWSSQWQNSRRSEPKTIQPNRWLVSNRSENYHHHWWKTNRKLKGRSIIEEVIWILGTLIRTYVKYPHIPACK